jgi:F0F1-type ATP synthase membrane subunit b/b'
MSFTKLELAPQLNPLFEKCIADCANVAPGMSSARAVANLKAACLSAAKNEINRQGRIYTSEEQAYITKIKRMHEEAKPLAFTMVDYAQKLAQAWDDKMFAEMSPKVEFIGEMVKEAHDEMSGAVAHQGWRGNVPWKFDKAELAIGKEGQAELFQLFKSHRDPMIAATADLKTFVIKLEEFYSRGTSSLKAAETCKARARVDAGGFIKEVNTLGEKAKKAEQDVDSKVKTETNYLQKFIVLCNTKKTKLDPNELKVAEGNQTKNEIWIKNTKTTTKTLEVERGNVALRVNKSVAPGQLGAMNTKLGEIATSLQNARKDVEQLAALLEIHKKKLTEAKNRK